MHIEPEQLEKLPEVHRIVANILIRKGKLSLRPSNAYNRLGAVEVTS